MGTHPIFESDFDCLTEVRNCVRNLNQLTKMSIAPKVAPTRLVIGASNQLQYDPDEPILGITRRDYEVIKKHYPHHFEAFIENPTVHDETKAAMIKYMQTGEIQPCTGAGMTNPIDRTIAKYPAATSIFVMIIAIPLSVTTFILLRKHHMRLKEDAMMKLR